MVKTFLRKIKEMWVDACRSSVKADSPGGATKLWAIFLWEQYMEHLLTRYCEACMYLYAPQEGHKFIGMGSDLFSFSTESKVKNPFHHLQLTAKKMTYVHIISGA